MVRGVLGIYAREVGGAPFRSKFEDFCASESVPADREGASNLRAYGSDKESSNGAFTKGKRNGNWDGFRTRRVADIDINLGNPTTRAKKKEKAGRSAVSFHLRFPGTQSVPSVGGLISHDPPSTIQRIYS